MSKKELFRNTGPASRTPRCHFRKTYSAIFDKSSASSTETSFVQEKDLWDFLTKLSKTTQKGGVLMASALNLMAGTGGYINDEEEKHPELFSHITIMGEDDFVFLPWQYT